MNHAFKFLYRHDFHKSVDNENPMEFLIQEGGYTREQVLQMNQTFPVLLQLSVPRQLFPKMQFLKHTLGISNPSLLHHRNDNSLPPHYFGSRLERIVAPRHAFLVWMGLPSGQQLFAFHNHSSLSQRSYNHTCLFPDFLAACRNTKHFAALCQSWRDQQQQQHSPETLAQSPIPEKITSQHIEAFEAIFSRGLLAAVRNEFPAWARNVLPNLTAVQVTTLLIQHGANVWERDHRGASLLHWACGFGQVSTVPLLLKYISVADRATRCGSTPLHWASAGCNAREFGTGGHVVVSQQLLTHLAEDNHRLDHKSIKEYVNIPTYDGNTALMWAAWSGSLDTVKLLVRNLADVSCKNRNGCGVEHWSSSGGNLEVCRYLAEVCNVDFTTPNYGGNTPLTHAVAFGRTDVVNWLLQRQQSQNENKDDVLARSLAQDFVAWEPSNDQRKNILQLFGNDGWDGESESYDAYNDDVMLNDVPMEYI
jgi:ankyrin repeat protein